MNAKLPTFTLLINMSKEQYLNTRLFGIKVLPFLI